MWLVAVAAGDARREHPALFERAVIVDFVEHLPVGVIETSGERRDKVGIRQRGSWHPILGKLRASRMAHAASLDLPACLCGCNTALRIAGLRVGLPGNAVPFVQESDEPLQGGIVLSERPPAPLTVRPVDVSRA